jgi:hypothetical protein
MGKRRCDGRVMALALIGRRGKDGASALDIGVAMLAARSPRHRHMSKAARESMGLEMAASLVRGGLVVATRNNRFMLARYQGHSVPPSSACA